MDEGIATTTRVIPVRGVSSFGFLDGISPPPEGIATTTGVIPVRGVSSLGFLDGTPPP